LDAKQMGEVSATFDDIKPELVSELQTAIWRSRTLETEVNEGSIRSKQSVQRRYH
jgi:hypothetical protein